MWRLKRQISQYGNQTKSDAALLFFPILYRWTAVVGLVGALILLLEYRGQADKPVRVGMARWGLAGLALGSNLFMTFWLFTCHRYYGCCTGGVFLPVCSQSTVMHLMLCLQPLSDTGGFAH